MADQLDIDSELFQQVAEEEHLRPDACHRDCGTGGGGHIDLVGNACEVVAACLGHRGICYDGLPALAEFCKGVAEFLIDSQVVCSHVCLEVYQLHAGIGGGCLYSLDSIPQSYGGKLGFRQQPPYARGRRLDHLHLAEVHLEHTLSREDDLSASAKGRCYSAKECGKNEKSDNAGEEEPDDYSQYCFPESFHF